MCQISKFRDIHHIINNDPSSLIILFNCIIGKSIKRKFVLALSTAHCALCTDLHSVQHVKEHLPQPCRPDTTNTAVPLRGKA